MSLSKFIEMYFDGSSLGNPGRAGCGCVLMVDQEEVWSESYFVGENETNNKAEYTGLIKALEEIERRFQKGPGRVIIKGDSLLVIRQMQGNYAVKSNNLKALYHAAKEIESRIRERNIDLYFLHVPRSENSRADELSRLCVIQKSINNPVKTLSTNA